MITVPKIVLIVLLIIAVWVVFRWLNGAPSNLVRRRQPPPPRPQARSVIEDLVACPTCGAFVAAGARGCGRTACPLPR